MKRLLILVTILLLTFAIFLFSSLNINAASNEETILADENISNLEDENTENSVRSVPGGEEPDNEDWYGIELTESGIPENHQEIDYDEMLKLLTHLKPGDIIYEPNGAFVGDLVGHIAMVYDIVYDEDNNQHYVITIESYTGGVQYGLMTPARFESKDVEIYRLTDASEEQIQGAIAWAQTQLGDAWFLKTWKRNASDVDVWYCAELIWAAYFHQGIYLDQDDNNDWGSVVWPAEVAAYENAIPILHDGGEDYEAVLTSDGDTYHTYSYNGKTYTEEHKLQRENINDGSYHREYCTICTYSKIKPHNYICCGGIGDVHFEECIECGYANTGVTNAEFTSVDENNHSRVCTTCGFTINVEAHNWVYTSISALYHEGHCADCGEIKTTQQSHSWKVASDPQYVECSYCGHLKLKPTLGGGEIIPVQPFKKDELEEETE